jgi:integrase
VFPTRDREPRSHQNVRKSVLAPSLKRADELLALREEIPLPAGVTPHKLRHTYASILIAIGKDPAYVMNQLGHHSPNFTMRVYTHLMRRSDPERAQLKALVEGLEWAPMGTETPERSREDIEAFGS